MSYISSFLRVRKYHFGHFLCPLAAWLFAIFTLFFLCLTLLYVPLLKSFDVHWAVSTCLEYVEIIFSHSLKKVSRQRNWHNKYLNNFAKLQFWNAKIYQNTNFAKLPSATWLFFICNISLTSSNNQFSEFRIFCLFTCLVNSRARHSEIYILKSRNLF